jgi:hypothetical protein
LFRSEVNKPVSKVQAAQKEVRQPIDAFAVGYISSYALNLHTLPLKKFH